jgi:hypothetical protein
MKHQRLLELVEQVRSTGASVLQADVARQQLWLSWLQSVAGLLTLTAAVAAAFYAGQAAKEARRTADQAVDAREDADRALKIAQDNANSTQRLVETTSEHGRKNLRAYIDIAATEYARDYSKDTAREICVGIAIAITNFGNTPASEVLRKISYRCTAVGDVHPFIDDDTTDFYIGQLAKGDPRFGTVFIGVDPDLWDRVLSDRIEVVVRCQVSYLDVFGEEHHTYAAFRTRGPSIERCNGVARHT